MKIKHFFLKCVSQNVHNILYLNRLHHSRYQQPGASSRTKVINMKLGMAYCVQKLNVIIMSRTNILANYNSIKELIHMRSAGNWK